MIHGCLYTTVTVQEAIAKQYADVSAQANGQGDIKNLRHPVTTCTTESHH